jgi:Clp amino terminal domain, pathogenicity island component/ClpX C4-type zinc finger
VLVLAQEEARALGHPYIGTEHILLGLMAEGQDVAAQALTSFGVTLGEARERVDRAVAQAGGGGNSPPFTPRAKKVLELSLREALQLGDQYIGTGHLLLGLLREGDGLALQVLVGAGVDLNELRAEVLRRLGSEPAPAPAGSDPAVRRCSFCGRRVDEAEHFIAALGRGAICSDCIIEANRAVEEAAEEVEVFLPLRITGTPPDAGAGVSIAQAIEAAFVSDGSPARRRAAVEDYDEVQPFLALAVRAAPITATALTRIRFPNPTTAIVDFQTFSGPVGTYRTVRMVNADSQWYIPFDAMRTLLGELGVAVPRRRGEPGMS